VAIPQFICHAQGDSCAVAVIEGVTKGTTCDVWVMDNDELFSIEVLHDIPIGHKIALGDVAEGDTIIKYGEDIGRCVAGMKRGEHMHVHNVKTKRW